MIENLTDDEVIELCRLMEAAGVRVPFRVHVRRNRIQDGKTWSPAFSAEMCRVHEMWGNNAI